MRMLPDIAPATSAQTIYANRRSSPDGVAHRLGVAGRHGAVYAGGIATARKA